MNLYQINFEHYSQKDSKEGIATYLLAESDEQVYEWIDSNKKYGMYSDNESDKTALNDIPFKQSIIDSKGCMYNDYYLDIYCTDLYYGKTFFGWEEIATDIKQDEISVIKGLGISLDTY